MRKIALITILITMVSCVTMQRSRYIGNFTDENGKTYSIWKVEKYNRKTKELISTEVDTLISTPSYTSTTILK
jgi:hypothetical protein